MIESNLKDLQATFSMSKTRNASLEKVLVELVSPPFGNCSPGILEVESVHCIVLSDPSLLVKVMPTSFLCRASLSCDLKVSVVKSMFSYCSIKYSIINANRIPASTAGRKDWLIPPALVLRFLT